MSKKEFHVVKYWRKVSGIFLCNQVLKYISML